MPRKIRVSVEIYSHDPADEYHDLPEGWDELTEEQQDGHLTQWAQESLLNAAGSGAEVVEVDEHGNEVTS
jgi:hypothetical protein